MTLTFMNRQSNPAPAAPTSPTSPAQGRFMRMLRRRSGLQSTSHILKRFVRKMTLKFMTRRSNATPAETTPPTPPKSPAQAPFMHMLRRRFPSLSTSHSLIIFVRKMTAKFMTRRSNAAPTARAAQNLINRNNISHLFASMVYNNNGVMASTTDSERLNAAGQSFEVQDGASTSKPTSPPSCGSVRIMSQSPSRNGGAHASGTNPWALRILRVLIYSFAASNFLYETYAQVIVWKGPGRQSLLFTFHVNFHCTWYFCLCFLHSIFTLGCKQTHANNPKRQLGLLMSNVARMVEKYSHQPTAIVFTFASFVCLAHYLLLHIHHLNSMRTQTVPDHDAKMVLLHLNPLMFVLIDYCFKDTHMLAKHGLKKRNATRAINVYSLLYFTWTALYTKYNDGHWPYQFQNSFSVMQHLIFFLWSSLFATVLCRAGFRIHGLLDSRRRMHLSIMSDRLNSATHRNRN